MRRKAVKLPSDYLTAKGKEKLNGMPITYSMDKPHTYLELLAFPLDIRKEYVQGIIDRYSPSIIDLSRMMHINPDNCKAFLESLGISREKKYRSPDEKFRWRVFMGENITPPEPAPEPKVEPQTLPIEPFVPDMGMIQNFTLEVVGKPFAVANGLTTILNTGKKYKWYINITELEDETEDEGCICSAGEAC